MLIYKNIPLFWLAATKIAYSPKCIWQTDIQTDFNSYKVASLIIRMWHKSTCVWKASFGSADAASSKERGSSGWIIQSISSIGYNFHVQRTGLEYHNAETQMATLKEKKKEKKDAVTRCVKMLFLFKYLFTL